MALGVNPVIGQEFTATFHLSDANGHLADSEPFTIRFQIVPRAGFGAADARRGYVRGRSPAALVLRGARTVCFGAC